MIWKITNPDENLNEEGDYPRLDIHPTPCPNNFVSGQSLGTHITLFIKFFHIVL